MRETFAIRVYKQYFNFASSHFLIFADGTREELHGHNYQAQVKLEGELAGGDLVVDFIPFKPLVKRFCDELDHRTILPLHNPHLEVAASEDKVEVRHSDGSYFCFPRRDVKLLDIGNTSTENLARLLARKIARALPEEMPDAVISAIEVSVEESAGQSGICRLELDPPEAR